MVRKWLLVVSIVGALTGGVTQPVGAQPPQPDDVLFVDSLVHLPDSGGRVWIRAVNFYGLGLLQMAAYDPTIGLAFMASSFDYDESACSTATAVKIQAPAVAATTTNPAPHDVSYSLTIEKDPAYWVNDTFFAVEFTGSEAGLPHVSLDSQWPMGSAGFGPTGNAC